MPAASVRQSLPVAIDNNYKPQPIDAQVNMQAQSARVLLTIDAVESKLLAIPNPVIDDATLASLGFVRGASLPLEDDRVADPKDLFFTPYPNSLIDQMDFISFATYPRVAKWKATESVCAKVQQHQRPHVLPTGYMGDRDHPSVYGELTVGKVPEWYMPQAAYLSGKPHVRCIVQDTTIAQGSQVLRSELVCALKLMHHQMKCSHYAGSVVPVLVFSIGHTNVGRITQVHCDWPSGKIVLRQSRLLNFVPASGDGNIRDEEYWSELLYLLRWLEVSPVGKTQMATEAPDGTEE